MVEKVLDTSKSDDKQQEAIKNEILTSVQFAYIITE